MTVTLNQGAYFYDDTLGEWVPLDDADFLLAFNPGGAAFINDVIPKIRIVSVTSRNVNGETVDITYTVPAIKRTNYLPIRPYTTSEGTFIYIWEFLSTNAVDVTIRITNLPTPVNHGITAPQGFDYIRSWEVLEPYYGFNFDSNGDPIYDGYENDNDHTGYYEIKLSRATVDNIRHCAAYPYWNPSRDDHLRAIVAASGLGSLDFGHIQNVSTTFSPRLTVIPIACYGYKGTFCMDLGVTKNISISYIRTPPRGEKEIGGEIRQLPYNSSPDSRDWDNATWVAKLRELTDRWQMRTNGCHLYLKRPDAERLANGFPGGDPMVDYINEIDGENTYISSAPIIYQTGKPDMISGSISFTMGTLYPKQTPLDTIQITFQWENRVNADPPNDHFNGTIYELRKFVCHYPKGTDALLPAIPYTWGPQPINGSATEFYYGTDWVYNVRDGEDNTSEKVLSPDTLFNPAEVVDGIVRVNTLKVDKQSIRQLTDPNTTYSLTLKPKNSSVTSIKVSFSIVGGGGGGGGGSQMRQTEDNNLPSQRKTLRDVYNTYGGGGGGASGAYYSDSVVISPVTETYSTVVTAKVGNGGAGGHTSTYPGQTAGDGDIGGTSSVDLLGIHYQAEGGNPGKASESSWHNKDYIIYQPFSYIISTGGARGEGNPDIRSYSGGAGGESRYGDGGDYYHNGDSGSAPTSDAASYTAGSGGQGMYKKNNEVDGSLDITTKSWVSGGGGGGTSYLPTDGNYSGSVIKGGNGYPGSDPHNGGFGCGGCGGSVDSNYQPRDGGKGGNGFIRIVAYNGIFE